MFLNVGSNTSLGAAIYPLQLLNKTVLSVFNLPTTSFTMGNIFPRKRHERGVKRVLNYNCLYMKLDLSCNSTSKQVTWNYWKGIHGTWCKKASLFECSQLITCYCDFTQQ